MWYITASDCDTFGPCLRTRMKLCLTLFISTESPSFAWYYWDRICQRYTHSHYWTLRLSKYNDFVSVVCLYTSTERKGGGLDIKMLNIGKLPDGVG